METIAVYWEPKIRVYGLTTKSGLSLYILTIPTDRLAFWGQRISDLEESGREFDMVDLQAVSSCTMQFCLVLAEDDMEPDVRRLLATGMEDDGGALLQVVTPVELIYLHGPHFQDRYGIAEAAFSPLQKADIPILAAGCSGTSVYLVVAATRAKEAAACLSETFVL